MDARDVQDGDIAPLITSPNTASIAENGTAVLTVTAADPDGPLVGFSVVGGADAALFAINAVTERYPSCRRPTSRRRPMATTTMSMT